MTSPPPGLGQRIYLDTKLYIYLFEGTEEYRRPMADLTAEIDRRAIVVVASESIFVELLPRPVREGRRHLVEGYLELMQRTPRINLVPVDRRVILRAVHLRADFGLRSIDALHVATALVHGCDTFLTNDRHLSVGDSIRVLTLDGWRPPESATPGPTSRLP